MAMDYLECSSIEKVNESSFISDCGRQELMGRLREERRELVTIEGRGGEEPERKRKFKLSSKKLKQIFPCDFF